MSDLLRERFDSVDLAYIERIIEDRTPESLHLDFKRFGAESDRKKNLAKSIAGFANAEGGVVIWGITTTKLDSIDCAAEVKPLIDAARILDSFNRWSPDAASPTVEGVKHKALLQSDGKGVVVTFVPQCDTGPHMAKLGVNQYIKRNADRFLPMEHFEVADMFGRRPRAKLSLHMRMEVAGMDGDKNKMIRIFVGIKNSGRAMARQVFFRITKPNPQVVWTGIGPGGQFGLPSRQFTILSNWRSFGGEPSSVVFPDSEIEVLRFEVPFDSENDMFRPEFSFDYEIFAESVNTVRDSQRINTDLYHALLHIAD